MRVARRLLFGVVSARRKDSVRPGDGEGGDFSSWEISSPSCELLILSFLNLVGFEMKEEKKKNKNDEKKREEKKRKGKERAMEKSRLESSKARQTSGREFRAM